MSYNPSAPVHRLDTSTGWRVFAKAPDTETIYGNYRFKWTVIPPLEQGYYGCIRVHLSVDDGQTWMEENRVWSLYSVNYSLTGTYHDNNSDISKVLIAARDEWKVARRRKLDRERREEFNALPVEQRALIKAERSTAWQQRKEQAAERKAQRTAIIMSQMLQIGPELVRLKEDIEQTLSLMGNGGLDRSFPYYESRRRYLRTASWTVNDMKLHIENAHKRAEDKSR